MNRKCSGGPKRPWCGKPAVYVCTQGAVVATADWQGLQWFACAEHTDDQAKETIAEFETRLGLAAAPCSWCHGEGFQATNICTECKGTGKAPP